MSEMVERVAVALAKTNGGNFFDPNFYTEEQRNVWRTKAKDGIEAMRDPTADMLRTATTAEHDHFYPGKSPTSHTWKSLPAMLVKKLWSAMIDAALK